MASQVLTNAYILLNAVNLSAFVTGVTLNYSADIAEDTAMGDTAKSRLSGLKDWSVDIDFNQDYAASAVDVTLFGIVGSSVAIELRADAGAVSVTNPKFTGNVILESYSPISGSVGDKHSTKISLKGNGALTRATA